MFAELVDNRIVIQTRWDEKDLIKQVPGVRWDAESRVWTVKVSWAACIQLRGVFGDDLQVGPQLARWSWQEYDTRVAPTLQIRELLHMQLPPTTNDHDRRLFPFQVPGREFLISAGDALLADEPGTGKTVQALAAMRALSVDVALPALVVCPNSVKSHWVNHIYSWLPEATPYEVAGPAERRRKILATAIEDPLAVVIVNIEAMRLFSRLAPYGSIALKRCHECDKAHGDPNLTPTRCEVHPKPLNGFGFKTCILDEAHRVKDPKAKQTRAIWHTFHDDNVQRRWALTGTPTANHPGDLWSVMHAVAPDDFPRKSTFIDRYALLSWNTFGGMDIVGIKPDTREELFKILDPRFRRMTKDLVLPQLPAKLRSTRVVEMTPKQAKAYKELGESLFTRLDNGTLLVAKSNLSGATRLLQLTSSYVAVDRQDPEDPGTWQVELCLPSPKIDALLEIVDEHRGRPLAIAAEHRRLIELAAVQLEAAGFRVVQITGAVPDTLRPVNLAQFQRGDADVIMFTYKAGGVGLDMTRADTLIRLQRSWSLVDNKQGEDRIHRIGSERHEAIHIIDIITTNTIETIQLQRLNEKLERLEEITRDRARRLVAGQQTIDLDTEETAIMRTWLGSLT